MDFNKLNPDLWTNTQVLELKQKYETYLLNKAQSDEACKTHETYLNVWDNTPWQPPIPEPEPYQPF